MYTVLKKMLQNHLNQSYGINTNFSLYGGHFVDLPCLKSNEQSQDCQQVIVKIRPKFMLEIFLPMFDKKHSKKGCQWTDVSNKELPILT